MTREKESQSCRRGDSKPIACAAAYASAVLLSVSASQRSTLGLMASTRTLRILQRRRRGGFECQGVGWLGRRLVGG